MKTTFLMTILSALGLAASGEQFENLTTAQFSEFIKEKGVQIVDVRTPEEYSEGHIAASINIDVNEKNFVEEVKAKLSKDFPVAVYCRSGRRSANACNILAGMGFKAYNLSEGIIGWKAAGLPATTTGMAEVVEFIKSCGHYFIATLDEDGQPRVRPFGTINIHEGRVYIQTGHKKDVCRQIEKNGKVEICCFNGEQWIRLSGTLVEDPDVEAKKAMLDAYPELRSMYDENDENTAVFYFKNATARFCSFTKPEETVRF